MEYGEGWFSDLEQAKADARLHVKAVLLVFHRAECTGCDKMTVTTYPDPNVQRELLQWFAPVHLDIIANRAVRSHYSAYWTPSFFFLDMQGKLLHSFNGYLGAEDFRIILRLGKAAIDLPRGRYLQVIDLMDEGLNLFPANPRSAAMLFTRGMAEYLLGKEKSAFRGAMQEIVEQYPDSPEARMWPW